MPAPDPSTRRLAIAVGTAAASVTLALGVTAASLLGWFKPSGSAPDPAFVTSAPAAMPAPSPVILVPVAPTSTPQSSPAVEQVQLASDDEGPRGSYAQTPDDDERREHGRHHEENDEGHDDD